MKKILVMTTGGTIASEETPHGLIPALSPEQLLSYLPDISSDIELGVLSVCSIDSTDMTPEVWLDIAAAVKANYDKYDGFVICHGTDTMAYTACALSYLIQRAGKPIVLTGAQKPIGSEITDAKTNLRDSIIYAADEMSTGIVIVFDGKVIAGTRGRKSRTYSFAAFSSINYPELAAIQDGRIIRYVDDGKLKGEPVFCDKLNPRVFLLKLTPGVEPYLLDEIIGHYDCIIIESFGVGGIPATLMDHLAELLSKYKPEEKVLVLSTQVPYEGSNVSVYEVGRRVKERLNILEARDMTTEAIITKMMWILGQDHLTWEGINELFYKRINYDTIW